MLRGYAPFILDAVPRDGAATATQIHAKLVEQAVCRAPDKSTVNRHLGILVQMGCLAKEGRTYRRLVESEFDLPLEASA